MINDISICKFYENLIDAIDLGNFFINFLMGKEKNNFFLQLFIFPIEVESKFIFNGLLIIVLRAPINMTYKL